MSPRTDWAAVLEHAATIVTSYDTGVTLRQCFYRLVADGTLANTTSAYKGLSAKSAEARREGWFPDFIDLGREVHRFRTFDSADNARAWLASIYRHDRTEGQDWSVYLGVEKRGIVEQLTSWFGDLGVPVLALGGYASQTFVDEVAEDVSASERLAALLYAGDFDPSGEDIDRDFLERTGCFDKVERVALSAEQVEEHALPPQPGKPTDSRAAAFIERHGALVQVELDALAPDVLRGLYQDAIDGYWDASAYEDALEREEAEREELLDP